MIYTRECFLPVFAFRSVTVSCLIFKSSSIFLNFRKSVINVYTKNNSKYCINEERAIAYLISSIKIFASRNKKFIEQKDKKMG